MTGRPGQTRQFAKEKEKEENFWLVEKKNRKGKGGKYVEKQKVMLEENTEISLKPFWTPSVERVEQKLDNILKLPFDNF